MQTDEISTKRSRDKNYDFIFTFVYLIKIKHIRMINQNTLSYLAGDDSVYIFNAHGKNSLLYIHLYLLLLDNQTW